jgi:hypothetical protein
MASTSSISMLEVFGGHFGTGKQDQDAKRCGVHVV